MYDVYHVRYARRRRVPPRAQPQVDGIIYPCETKTFFNEETRETFQETRKRTAFLSIKLALIAVHSSDPSLFLLLRQQQHRLLPCDWLKGQGTRELDNIYTTTSMCHYAVSTGRAFGKTREHVMTHLIAGCQKKRGGDTCSSPCRKSPPSL